MFDDLYFVDLVAVGLVLCELFVVFFLLALILISSVLANRSAVKSVPAVSYLVSSETLSLNSVNHCYIVEQFRIVTNVKWVCEVLFLISYGSWIQSAMQRVLMLYIQTSGCKFDFWWACHLMWTCELSEYGLFQFQASGCKWQPNLAVVFLCLFCIMVSLCSWWIVILLCRVSQCLPIDWLESVSQKWRILCRIGNKT